MWRRVAFPLSIAAAIAVAGLVRVARVVPGVAPVALPTIVLIVLYPPVPRGSQVASGGLAAHADFMNGWDQAADQGAEPP